jgi:hypothetical protein
MDRNPNHLNAMTFKTRPMKWSHCNEDGPLSEQATEIEIIDEGAGEFVTLYQDASTKTGLVAITLEEWPTLRDSIDAAFSEIDDHQQP